MNRSQTCKFEKRFIRILALQLSHYIHLRLNKQVQDMQNEHKPTTNPVVEKTQEMKETNKQKNPQAQHFESKKLEDQPQAETPKLGNKNHSHQEGENIHQHGDHHHHYHHVEPPLIIKQEELVDPYAYLMDIYKMKEKVDSYYMQNNQEYVNYWKRQYGVNFSVEGWQLINYEIVINMEEFLKQDWRKVEYIGFAGCKIDDIKWRLFADHADLFPNLKWLSLQIKHTLNVKQGDMEKFKSLQRIQFNYEQWTHPLSIPSKNYLKAFAKSHPNVQVVFG